MFGSTSTTFIFLLEVSSKKWVKLPKPGPISKTFSPSPIFKESTIFLQSFESTKKFCPKSLLG